MWWVKCYNFYMLMFRIVIFLIYSVLFRLYVVFYCVSVNCYILRYEQIKSHTPWPFLTCFTWHYSLSLKIDHINFLFSSFEPYDHSKSFRITVINHYLLWIEYSYLSWLYYAVYFWSWIVYWSSLGAANLYKWGISCMSLT